MSLAAPRIALIHATALAMSPIQEAFARLWPQARCMNLLDDSLSVDRAEAGELTESMRQRFIDLALYAKGTGCRGILFTCSAFGPAIEGAGAACGLPTLKPNEAMFEQALDAAARGTGRIGLVATVAASIESMGAELQQMAQRRGQSIESPSLYVPEAMSDLAAGNSAMHHAKVARAVHTLAAAGCAVITLAQFSMAAAQPQAQTGLTVPVLSSPDCAVLALKGRMTHE